MQRAGDIVSPWGSAAIESPLIGRFNGANLLGVLGVLLVSGVKLNDAVATLHRLRRELAP